MEKGAYLEKLSKRVGIGFHFVLNKENDVTYLQRAVKWTDIAEILIDAGANVTPRNNDGDTAIDLLIEYYSKSRNEKEFRHLVALMISKGAVIDSHTIQKALDNEDGYEILPYLSEIADDQEMKDINPGLWAAIRGDDAKVVQAVKQENFSEKEKQEFLCCAAAFCAPDTLEYLKQAGFNFNIRLENGKNLLHLAAEYNQAESVSWFLSHGMDANSLSSETADPDKVMLYDWYPLTCASIGGKKDNIEVLLQAGAEWHSDWVTVCTFGKKDSVQLMLNYGYNPTREEIYEGYVSGNDDIFLALLENQMLPDPGNEEERGIASELCINEYGLARAQKLFELGAKIDGAGLCGVIEKQENDFAVKIMEQEPDLIKWCEDDASPLKSAVESGNYEMVKYLVEHGADANQSFINQETGERQTLLQITSESPSEDILCYLKEVV